VYNNRAWMKVGAEGKTFMPVEGNTGDQGSSVFYRPTLHGAYVAIFNLDEKKGQSLSVPLSRIETKLAGESSVQVVDVATGAMPTG
jgi:alpha-galactosidase